MIHTIRTIVFANPGTVLFEVGRVKGMFAEKGLEVTLQSTPSSVYMMTNLIDGNYDIAATAIDNVIAYTEGQGAAKTKNPADLIVFMGNPSYRLAFVVRPEISSWQGLKGKKIAVDALSTGFAFLLRKMLHDNGLGEDDYTFDPIGAPKARWKAIAAGTHAGSLLTDQFVHVAKQKGFKVLRSEPDPWENYQGAVLATRRNWAQKNPDALKGFIRAFLEAAAWTLHADNYEELTTILKQYMPQVDNDRVKRIAKGIQGPDSIVKPDMPLSIEGVKTVLELRSRYGRPQKKLEDPFKYLDLSFYEEVLRS